MKKSLILMAACCLASAHLEAKNLATGENLQITEEQFKNEVQNLGPQAEAIKENPETRRRFLDQMITIDLLASQAEKSGLDKDAEFQEKLASIKDRLMAQTYLETYIEKATNDKELEQHFKAHENRFNGEEVCASHILFKEEDKAQAEKILAEALKPGTDFGELAKQHSTGPSGPRNGNLGCFGRGRMVPEFEAAAFNTKKGDIHNKLVKTEFGYHIIKVDDLKAGKPVKFAEVKDQVTADMQKDLREKLISDLKASAKVTVDDKALEGVKF